MTEKKPTELVDSMEMIVRDTIDFPIVWRAFLVTLERKKHFFHTIFLNIWLHNFTFCELIHPVFNCFD